MCDAMSLVGNPICAPCAFIRRLPSATALQYPIVLHDGRQFLSLKEVPLAKRANSSSIISDDIDGFAEARQVDSEVS